MGVFQDDGYEMKHTDEFLAKRRRTFILLCILQLLCCVAILVGLLFIPSSALLISFITAPLFILMHITFIKGITSLKDEGASYKKQNAVRWIVLIVYLLIFFVGVFASI